jgi:hypothetical protein
LHPADRFDIETGVLDQVVDVIHSADVFVREETMLGGGPVGDYETFILVLSDSRDGEAHLLRQDPD